MLGKAITLGEALGLALRCAQQSAHDSRSNCWYFIDRAWWAGRDLNPQPDRYERPALTIELPARQRQDGSI